jgi:hypothetical protein
LCIIYCTDNIFPSIMTMSGVVEGDMLWPAVLALEALIVIVLLLPWVIAAYVLIGFILRILNLEREEWAT